MKIYHGSTEIIEKPLILESQRLLDFGKGYYTTTNSDQAEKWAVIKRNRIGNEAKSIVSEYEFDEKLLFSERYRVKIFEEADEEWLDFVVINRRVHKNHPFDLVKGAVANDTLYRTLSLFETGILTKNETISRLKVHELFDQISFHNNDLLKELKFIRYYDIL